MDLSKYNSIKIKNYIYDTYGIKLAYRMKKEQLQELVNENAWEIPEYCKHSINVERRNAISSLWKKKNVERVREMNRHYYRLRVERMNADLVDV